MCCCNSLWYDDTISEEMAMRSWSRMVNHLCGHWNVFAVDLQNEPHAASWGKGMGRWSDWGHAAERLGNLVLGQCRRLLIFVEGVGSTPGAPGMDDVNEGVWWGENLAGARLQPVTLSVPGRLVYSPLVFGPGIYMQRYFQEPAFPFNLQRIYEERWGYLASRRTAPPGTAQAPYVPQTGMP